MGGFEASVRRARAEQADLIEHDEHCSVDPERLASIGRGRGQQVRVTRAGGEKAIYTVGLAEQEENDVVVRMGLTGRERIGAADEFAAVVSDRVVADLDDEQAAEQSEFVERLSDGGQSELIVLAPHGGDIERHTDEQAERVGTRLPDSTVWLCRGFSAGPGTSQRFHITSGDIREESFPALGRVAGRGFRYAVAFHGFTQPEPVILVGGAGPCWLKLWVASAVRKAVAGSAITVRVGRAGEPFNGDDPQNIVNRLTVGGANGVQLEQTLDARSAFGAAIADAVAGVYDAVLRRRFLLIAWWRLRCLLRTG